MADSYLVLKPDESEPWGYTIVGIASGAKSKKQALADVGRVEEGLTILVPWEPVTMEVTTETIVTVTEVEAVEAEAVEEKPTRSDDET